MEAIVTVFEGMFGRRPRFAVYGGTPAENLALQNIQARLRMVLAYMCAQLLPWIRRKQVGFVFVVFKHLVLDRVRFTDHRLSD